MWHGVCIFNITGLEARAATERRRPERRPRHSISNAKDAILLVLSCIGRDHARFPGINCHPEGKAPNFFKFFRLDRPAPCALRMPSSMTTLPLTCHSRCRRPTVPAWKSSCFSGPHQLDATASPRIFSALSSIPSAPRLTTNLCLPLCTLSSCLQF